MDLNYSNHSSETGTRDGLKCFMRRGLAEIAIEATDPRRQVARPTAKLTQMLMGLQENLGEARTYDRNAFGPVVRLGEKS